MTSFPDGHDHLTLVLVIILCVAVFYCKKNGRPVSAASLKAKVKTGSFPDLVRSLAGSMKAFFCRHFGIRFLSWKSDEWKNIREDILQNVMVIINGALAINFAFRQA